MFNEHLRKARNAFGISQKDLAKLLFISQQAYAKEEIPSSMTTGGQEYIGLRVRGDSMYPKYMDGDTVIIHLQPDCESGQDAVVYINGYDATLKKVIKKQDCIILQPLNPSYEPRVCSYNDEDKLVKYWVRRLLKFLRILGKVFSWHMQFI